MALELARLLAAVRFNQQVRTASGFGEPLVSCCRMIEDPLNSDGRPIKTASEFGQQSDLDNCSVWLIVDYECTQSMQRRVVLPASRVITFSSELS
jgi:hypothetical protein